MPRVYSGRTQEALDYAKELPPDTMISAGELAAAVGGTARSLGTQLGKIAKRRLGEGEPLRLEGKGFVPKWPAHQWASLLNTEGKGAK